MLLLLAACSDYELKDDPTDPGPGTPPECAATPPPAPAVEIDDDCLIPPDIGALDATVEWQWTNDGAGNQHVIATPVAADIDGDGTVEVAFVASADVGSSSPAVLVVVDGATGAQRWTGGLQVASQGGVAIGQLDGTGPLELCVGGLATSVACWHGDGTIAFTAGTGPAWGAVPAMADLDGDGLGEVILGTQIYAWDGTSLGSGSSDLATVPVDLDGDGQLELVGPYGVEGWWAGAIGGNPAVADLDGDGSPETIHGLGSVLEAHDALDGTLRWTVAIPGVGGGTPLVADVDGDDAPEIGIITETNYVVFEADGTLKWATPVVENGGSVTGSAGIDLEGDGSYEIVYADQNDFYILAGADGAVRATMPGHSSGTVFEYPSIADIDGDGSAEVLVASNHWAGQAEWHGVTAIGSASSSWSPARPIWNQYAYDVSNVADDGTLRSVPPWTEDNSFRSAAWEPPAGALLADLALAAEVCTDTCGDSVTLYVTVVNTGWLDASATVLGASLGVVPAGGSAQIAFELEKSQWPTEIAVETATDQCDEADDRLALGPWPC